MSKFVKDAITKDLRGRLEGVEDALLVDVIGLKNDKNVALRQRLPPPILFTLIGVALLGMSVLGYAGGVAGARAVMPTTAVAVAVATVMVLIVELDRPGGVFRVSQAAMFDARDAMAGDRAPVVHRERRTGDRSGK